MTEQEYKDWYLGHPFKIEFTKKWKPDALFDEQVANKQVLKYSEEVKSKHADWIPDGDKEYILTLKNASNASEIAKIISEHLKKKESKANSTLTQDVPPLYPVGNVAEDKGGKHMFYLLPMAIEFYTLESLVLLEHKLSAAYRKSLHAYRDTLYDKMSLILRDYIVVASFGEARHGITQAPVYIPEIANERCYIKERTVAGNMATQYTYESICANLELLFYTNGWSGGYGGTKWGKAVKALKLVSHPRLFIDHCFDLKHNGSNLFNKTDYNMVSCGDLGKLQYYLDKRLHSEPEWLIRHYVMPDGNRGTLTRYANKILGTQHKPKSLDFMAEVLAYQPLVFGTQILSEPVLRPKFRSCHQCKAIFILYGDEHFCPKHLPDNYTDCNGCKQAYKLMKGESNVQEKKEQTSGTSESESRKK